MLDLKKKNLTDPLAEFRAKDPHVHEFPKSCQQAIDIVKVAENGIFELPGERFSATWRLKDINYKLLGEEERDSILYRYATKVINPIQDKIKITLINEKKDIQEMEEEYLYPNAYDDYDELRKNVNTEVLARIKNSRQGFHQSKYITITCEADKVMNIDLKFQNMNEDLTKGLAELGSDCIILNGDERLNLIHKVLNPNINKKTYLPSLSTMTKKNRSFLDEIVNMQGFDFSNPTYERFRIGKKYCSALYVTSYPDIISDDFIDKLMNFPVESIISIDAVPISAEAARKFISGIYNDVENKIRKQQEIRNKNRNYATDISESVKAEKKDVKEYMEQARESCEKMYLTGITMIVMTDTLSELLSTIESIKVIADKEQVNMETAWMQQKEAFMTALPIGNRYTDNLRTTFTSDIATLCPFQAANLETTGIRICYGIDRINDEPLMGNRKNLTFGGGFYLGKPGSGKSCDAKWEMANILAGTTDKIIVIDPTLEYKNEVDIFKGAYLNFSPDTDNYLNPLNIDIKAYGSGRLDDFINDTADFMLVMFSLMMPGETGIVHRTIISRSVRQLYKNIEKLPKEQRYIPILSDLKEVIEEQQEPEARKLSLALELFTTGGFSMFNHQTNVVLNSRYTCFGIRDVGKNMFGLAMLCINRYIDEQVDINWKNNTTTWIYYDEVHELLKVDQSADYLDKSWRKHRKQNAIDTGLTHTLEEIVKNEKAETMVKNSEFLMLLKSSQNSVLAMRENIEGFKPEFNQFLLNAPTGYGVMKHGSVIIPVNARIQEDNPLLRIFNTDPLKKFEEDD